MTNNLTIKNIAAGQTHPFAEVRLDGILLTVKSISIMASVDMLTEVALVLQDVSVNVAQNDAEPDSAPTAEDPSSIFKTLCQGCGKLFRNGDGHTCR